MALNAVTAAIAFLLAASTVSMVTVGSISLVKTIKAEKQWTAIDTKLEAVKNSSGMSSLEESIDQNNEMNKEDQKKQKAQIDLINTKEQLKQDIKARQAKIEQSQKDLDDANALMTKLEKAVHTSEEMRKDFDAILATKNTNADVRAHLDARLWDAYINAATGFFRYNWNSTNEIAGNKDTVLNALAATDGQRSGAAVGGGVVLKQMLASLGDQDASIVGAGAAALATAVERGPALNLLSRKWQSELKQKITDVKKLEAEIAKAREELKAEEVKLENMEKNK